MVRSRKQAVTKANAATREKLMITCSPSYFSRWWWAGKLSCSVLGSGEGLWFGVGWGEQQWWSLLAPGSKPGCAEALMEVAGVLWELPGRLSHDWWPLPLPWFPGPLCQHIWVLPAGKCSLAPHLVLCFVLLRVCLRVSDLRHSWLPDTGAAQLAWNPSQASVLWHSTFFLQSSQRY